MIVPYNAIPENVPWTELSWVLKKPMIRERNEMMNV